MGEGWGGESRRGIWKDRSARRFFQLGGSKGSCRIDGVVGSAKESHRRTMVAGGEEGGGEPWAGERGREGDGAGENWKRVAEGGLSSVVGVGRAKTRNDALNQYVRH